MKRCSMLVPALCLVLGVFAARVSAQAEAGSPAPGNFCTIAIQIPSALPYTSNWNFSSSFLSDDGPPGSCNGSGSPEMRESVWFEWLPTANCAATVRVNSDDDKVLLVLSGTCGGLTEVACADTFFEFQSETATFNAVAGTLYYILVGNFNAAGNDNIFSIALTCGGLPFNDECTGASSIQCNTTVLADTRFGTMQTNDPNALPCFNAFGHGSLWYSFTPVGTTATVFTDFLAADPGERGQSLDTLLEVYSGACGSLTQVACNDDISPTNRLSRVELTGLTAGQTYRVRVAAKTPIDMARYELTVECGPATPGDECAGALPISCNGYAEVDLATTTSNPSDPIFPCRFGGAGAGLNSAWFSFVASRTSVRLSTRQMVGSTADDTLLALYSGTCGALTQIACDDDSFGPGLLSSLTANNLTVGQTYLVQLAAWQASEIGRYGLVLECGPPGGGTCQDVPPGAILENEACDAQNPSICFNAVPIPCNAVIAGTMAQINLSNPEVDNFEFTTEVTAQVLWCVSAPFPLGIQIYEANGCTPVSAFGSGTGACDQVCVSATLPPGTYIVVIQTIRPEILPCVGINGYTATLTTIPVCPGDFNGDFSVNTADLVAFLGAFGRPLTGCRGADFNNDGAVNTSDLVTFLGRFGQSCMMQ